MFTRLTILWALVRDSLWFIPAVFTLLAVGLALLMVRLDYQFESSVSELDHWLLSGGADGARLILSTIAGSLMTVTGVVFSVTIVALQLASSQFTPRILRNFTANRSNQVVLAVFISTFTYTLLVLRVVRSPLEDDTAFVPHLSVAVAIILSLVSIGFLIYFIHHAARSIQASVILDRVTAEALAHVKRMFPREIGEPEAPADMEPDMPLEQAQEIVAQTDGYLQAVDSQALFEFGAEQQVLIRMAVPVGAFIVKGQPVAQVWAETSVDEQHTARIRSAFVLGDERTPENDFEFFIIEIADIAVKALSPGINDPTTALHCIDRLTQLLLAFGKRRPPAPLRTQDGRVHFLAMPTTFGGVLRLSFDQILHYGCKNPEIVRKMWTSLELLKSLLPAERQAALDDYLHCLKPHEAATAEPTK